MPTSVEAPKLGNTVEEVLISRWIKRKGEAVAAGDVVLEIETDKTTFEVTAPVAGTLLETFAAEGDYVPVFSKLFEIGGAGETASPVSPRAQRFAEQHGISTAGIKGSGPGGRVLEQDLKPLAVSQAPPSVKPVRQTIARRMRESLASTAQYTLHGSADATALLLARAGIKAGAAQHDININELVAFCTVQALREMPELNAEYVAGEIRRHAEIHLGFAVDTPRGLLVPVVRNAHTLSPGTLSARMKELAADAAAGKIAPDDLAGATFTISNLGNLGIEWFTPVINPPQVAILGVGSIELKLVRRNGTPAFVDCIGLSLTCDHQVIDGAPGARFLRVLKKHIEHVEVPQEK